MKSPLFYRFFATDRMSSFFILMIIPLGTYQLITTYLLTDEIQKIVSGILYLLILFSTFFLNKVFPKSRFLFGKNAVLELRLEKFRIGV